jgi:hypothetical protein
MWSRRGAAPAGWRSARQFLMDSSCAADRSASMRDHACWRSCWICWWRCCAVSDELAHSSWTWLCRRLSICRRCRITDRLTPASCQHGCLRCADCAGGGGAVVGDAVCARSTHERHRTRKIAIKPERVLVMGNPFCNAPDSLPLRHGNGKGRRSKKISKAEEIDRTTVFCAFGRGASRKKNVVHFSSCRFSLAVVCRLRSRQKPPQMIRRARSSIGRATDS